MIFMFHIPEGAIPKDGPSAGVTIATSLISVCTNIPVRWNVAMSGEITLRGNVLPVGGIKEKVLAAQRAGIKKMILPLPNKKDLVDIPARVRQEMQFIFVEDVKQVFKEALAGSFSDQGVRRLVGIKVAQKEPEKDFRTVPPRKVK